MSIDSRFLSYIAAAFVVAAVAVAAICVFVFVTNFTNGDAKRHLHKQIDDVSKIVHVVHSLLIRVWTAVDIRTNSMHMVIVVWLNAYQRIEMVIK